MGLSRLFKSSAPAFKFKNLSSAGYSAATPEYGNEGRILDDIHEIIKYYDTYINPQLKTGENKLAHYLKRLKPWNTQKFFCGQKGQVRAQRLSELLDAKGFSSPKILRDICEHAYAEYKAAYTNSWTASRILWCMGYHLGRERSVTTKQIIYASQEGGGTDEYEETESLKSYLEGVYHAVMRQTFSYRNEEKVEQEIKQEGHGIEIKR